MKLKIHNVLSLGAFIYAFFLVFGFYFGVMQSAHVELSQVEIAMLLSTDGNTDNGGDTQKKSKVPNSRMLIEDDDDSAKDLLNEMNFSPEVYAVPQVFHIETYAPYQKEIVTPPPKG